MLHVPHPLDGERGPGEESAQDQLAALLGRALNSFDLPDELVERLDSAMAHTTSLHSSLHTSAAGHRLSRETYRHCYLLLDGTTVTLWEVAHHDGREYAHEVYPAEEEARIAAARLRRRHLPPDGPAGADDERTAPREVESLDALGHFEDCWEAGLGPDALVEPRRGTPRGGLLHPYAPDDSADHARRLLRRAENRDRPGHRTALRLRAAHAHWISQAFGSHCRPAGQDAAFTLYEHAFLLLDGSELSLWEVEHTATPDGRHMCEVYGSEQAARTAMERRARVS
ncbi:DUF6227 family protein [Streptomyces sp. NBC_00083]|uniref:DUF6227 family protein n=1 Tax=Streptomyces sp. NBC_00083 TaxID=2975647 RepID=UPI00224C8AC7|nr:DUF6227 family protein [Streptomyces sp. NBC_00083]MCX5381898.1 DUF6227 family protein [Streptomyces sp. NBC_00083]